MLSPRSFLRNLSLMVVMRLVSAAMAFTLFWYIARVWGAERLGAFALLFAISVFCQQLPLLGLHIPLIREVATDAPLAATRNSTLALLALLVSLVVGILVVIMGMNLYPSDMHASFWLVGAAMLPTAWTAVAEAILTGQQRMHLIARVNLAESVLRVALSFAVIGAGMGLTALFAVFLACRACAAGGYFYLGPWPAIRMRHARIRTLWQYVAELPVYGGIHFLAALLGKLDVFALSLMLGLAELGLYASALKIYEVALMAPSVLAMVLFPAFSRAATAAESDFQRLYRQTFFWGCVASLPCAVAIACLAGAIVSGLFGSSYLGAANVLQVLILAVVLVGMNQTLALLLLAKKAPELDLRALAAALVALFALLALLVPRFGYLGAAWAVAGSMLVQLIFHASMAARRFGATGLFVPLVRPVAGAAAMAAVMVLLRDSSPFLALVAGFLTYGIALAAMGTLNPRNLSALVAMLRHARENGRG